LANPLFTPLKKNNFYFPSSKKIKIVSSSSGILFGRIKDSNNNQSYDCTGNSQIIKKEEKIQSQISINEPNFQPMFLKSCFSNKK
jgi:hypothetical protein